MKAGRLKSDHPPVGVNATAIVSRRFEHVMRSSTGSQGAGQDLPVRQVIHPKLTLSHPGDRYEQEADQMADAVMRMPDPVTQRHGIDPTPLRHPAVQRACLGCRDEPKRGEPRPDSEYEEPGPVLRKVKSAHDAPAASIPDDVLLSPGPGRPLDPAALAFFEPRFGVDFSHVRVHTGTRAAKSARSVDASAYTIGSDIVFEQGEYAPQSDAGRRLLAHELTHVVQQQRASSSLATGPLLQRRPRKTPPPAAVDKSKIAAEDVAGIIAEQMQMWYVASRFGIQNASLAGDDEAVKWFLVALAGNLVWAATAFVAPEAAIAIRIMSIGGATVGSGTIEKLARQDLPIDDFRAKVAESLSQAYRRLIENRPQLTEALQAIYAQSGLTARDNAQQAEQRRKAAWHYLFRDTVGYMSPGALENNAKSDIEAIWKDFLPCYRSLYTVITPNYISSERAKYALVCYYRAIVSSGVADRSSGVTKISYYAVGGDKDKLVLGAAGDVYQFPGGATVTRGPPDLWWGDLTGQVP